MKNDRIFNIHVKLFIASEISRIANGLVNDPNVTREQAAEELLKVVEELMEDTSVRAAG
jgi:hypothetical protein